MFTVNGILANKYPALNRSPVFGPPLRPLLRQLLREKHFSRFYNSYPHLEGMDFVEQVMEHFRFSYVVSDRDRENIPSQGRLVIVANHPIGTLDGLALLKLIHEVRSDVRIVANDLLMHLRPLRSCLLPVENMGKTTSRSQLRDIEKSLKNEEAVIIFPAGEVSRLSVSGVKDGRWHKGFLRLADKAKAPILPVRISGRNSIMFYAASMVYKPMATFLLINEMFRHRDTQVRFTVGKIIPYISYQRLPINTKEKAKLFKKHLYRVGRDRKPIFKTESALARPERRQSLKKALYQADLIGETPDKKMIFLYSHSASSPVLREIGRLREITFRSVEEGTGKRRDVDHFDSYYKHLILWDENDLEIVGAYRLADSCKVIEKHGREGLYTNNLFSYTSNTHSFFVQGLELGRSFIQQRYWKKRSLDYLWYGIGAFLAKNPDFRYLFGPVSISSGMPQAAKDLLVYYYKLYFGADDSGVFSKNPFVFSMPVDDIGRNFCGENRKKDFKKLKALLHNMGTAVPTLFNQYSKLCEPGGVRFLDFNVDPDFNNCVDGLVVVDLTQLQQKKRNRYMNNFGNYSRGA